MAGQQSVVKSSNQVRVLWGLSVNSNPVKSLYDHWVSNYIYELVALSEEYIKPLSLIGYIIYLSKPCLSRHVIKTLITFIYHNGMRVQTLEAS